MRFLHTSDWHVGKTLKGHNRLGEQAEVLGEIVAVAREQEVDAVLIAGDLYDTAAPSAEAQRLVVRTLLGLRDTGASVVAIAGNHDSATAFEAYRPLMNEVGITLVGTPRQPEEGGVVQFTAAGEPVTVAVLPFVSQRYAVNAAELVTRTPAENSGAYDQQMRNILAALEKGFRTDAVNLVMAHVTVMNGAMGGGERQSQSIFEYTVPASAFPQDAHYVALGHLHRRQEMPAPAPVHYSGSPIAVDFGEEENTSVVCLVEASPGTPARVNDIPLRTGRRLRTVRGTLNELTALAGNVGEDFLRVYVREPARAGLREIVQDLLPHALEVRIDPDFIAPTARDRAAKGPRPDRTPTELFRDYCARQNVDDRKVESLFASLLDGVTGERGKAG